MENGGLFTPGFAGAQFNWWIGQIADDSTWRDNSSAGKIEESSQVPGWGKRYKVRIIGYHDKEEETVPSDQLPWANIMYPVTAGGGQASAFQSPNLRQGNFVFGFFLDGQDMQVPVIMGVLGNNAQTALKTTAGTTDSNFGPTSGFSESSKGSTDPNRKAPDADLVVKKPKSQAQKDDTSPPPPGTKLNKYGLDPSKPLTSEQLADSKAARAEADARGLTETLAREDFVMKKVAEGIAARKAAAESPDSPSQPGAVKENADNFHQQAIADVKKNNQMIRKVPLANPYDSVNSSMKNMQIVLENLTNDITSILETATSYVDAASNVLGEIDVLIESATKKLAKYMKPMMDKVMEFITKTVQAAMAPLSDTVFPNMRNIIGDLQENVTTMINCLFEKVVAGLGGQMTGLLKDGLGLDASSNPAGLGSFLEKLDTETPTPPDSFPKVPMCYCETLVGDLLASNKQEITDSIDNVITNVGGFLEGITAQMEEVSGGISALGGGIPSMDGIMGDMGSALSFDNIKLSVFGCDLEPKASISDFYTFATGSSGVESSQAPNLSEVSEKAAANEVALKPQEEVPFASPARDESDVDLAARITAEENSISDVPADQNPDPASNTVVRDDVGIDQALQDSQNQVPVQDGDIELL